MSQISREALLKNRLRFTASGWGSIITSCLMWSSGSLYISLKNRNSSKAMSARGRNGNKKTAVAWLCTFPCSSGFVLVVCSWERGLINWKLSPHKFFERNKTKSSLFLHSSYGLSPPSILILIGLCC